MSMSSSRPRRPKQQQHHRHHQHHQHQPHNSTRITDDTTRSGFPSAWHVMLLLVALRIVNALAVKSFYVPDEYYQSLEPAWQLAFGSNSGAWITWEWRNQLRSSLHPILFAGIYRAVSSFSDLCHFSQVARAALLLAAPRITQGTFAAGLDFFTWRLADSIYGNGSHVAWTTLAVSVLSPWQWFCSTRTLSNCLEASLTAGALYFWPWHWVLTAPTSGGVRPNQTIGDTVRLQVSLLLAAIASILRPTNVLIWIPISLQSLLKASQHHRWSLIVNAIACGSAVAASTAICDRLYYGLWTFPPLQFVHFNIAQSLAIFYGSNRLDYYLTEGVPLLLMTMMPFAILGLYRGLKLPFSRPSNSAGSSLKEVVPSMLAWASVFTIGSLSLISHKEARFLYPLLPSLHLFAASPLSHFARRLKSWRVSLAGALFAVNIGIAMYTSRVHQKGVVDVMTFLRSEHESKTHSGNTTVAFLMPCHSTPWRSHLIHSTIDAWALTCEPPINISMEQRSTYEDEADIFYHSPTVWLEQNMEQLALINTLDDRSKKWADQERNADGRVTGAGRSWPRYLVFFEQLEPQMKELLKDAPYRECWRGFNTHWHDDWRRQGDVVVWCMT